MVDLVWIDGMGDKGMGVLACKFFFFRDSLEISAGDWLARLAKFDSPRDGNSNIYYFVVVQIKTKGINGVVVTSIVAIDRPRVRFAVNANYFFFAPSSLNMGIRRSCCSQLISWMGNIWYTCIIIAVLHFLPCICYWISIRFSPHSIHHEQFPSHKYIPTF